MEAYHWLDLMHKEYNNGKLVSAEHVKLFSKFSAWAGKNTHMHIPHKHSSEKAQDVQNTIPTPINKWMN